MRRATIGAAALMLAGCGHLPSGHRIAPRGGETITYEFSDTALCGLGECKGHTITLGPDGQGIFTDSNGHDHRFQASAVEVIGFAQRLEPLRPKGERLIVPNRPGCGRFANDGTAIDVRWQAAAVAPSHLRVYSSCRSAEAKRDNDALGGLPVSSLPLQPFLGSD